MIHQKIQLGANQLARLWAHEPIADAAFDGENASQAAEIVNGVYGTDTVTANYVQLWFPRFRSGIFDVKASPRKAGPSSRMSIKSQKESKLTGMLLFVASPRS
ncbi:hypothetical protein TNCV_1244361 [Trichonephila clavipes]|nr:hypothetical protein TNCV_1244361 [Trichonephila clavipes]